MGDGGGVSRVTSHQGLAATTASMVKPAPTLSFFTSRSSSMIIWRSPSEDFCDRNRPFAFFSSALAAAAAASFSCNPSDSNEASNQQHRPPG